MAELLTNPGRFIRRSALAVAAGLALAASAAAVTLATGPLAQAATSCQHATGPFTVSGTQVLGAGGKVFTPYGITVPGLANDPGWAGSVSTDETKIRAAVQYWCVNTIRLQVSQDNLIGDTGSSPPDQAYLTAIKTEVSLAESLGLVVVLNDQTETAPVRDSYQQGPTPGTETFWKDLIPDFGSDHQVIFDLFNEPSYNQGTTQSQEWSLWHIGGTYQGATYIGMAKLAADLRAADTSTLFWAEGPAYASTFAGMERYNAVLSTSNLLYAVHHPAGDQNSSVWYDDFGYLINTGVAPVVDGEWTNYEPFPAANSECWTDAPTQVPAYLSYLADHGIGMTAYQLAPGLLIAPDGNYDDPTVIDSHWSCAPAGGPTDEGAGTLIRNWYQAHNG